MNATIHSEKVKPTARKHTRRSQSEWRELIERFGQSEISLEAFCQQHNIASSSFYAWRKRLECEAREVPPKETLVDITPQLSRSHSESSHKTAWQVELELGPACILRIKAG